MTITAIVPLKALPAAKGRLATALAPDDRRTVVRWMAEHVLLACKASELVDEVLLVAGDAAGASLGRAAGVRVLQIDQPGLQIALDAADVHVSADDITLTVAADLPAVTPAEIDAVVGIALAGAAPVVVITPTHDGGTGALVRRPPGVIRTAYGAGSARQHQELAARAGARCVVHHLPGLAADVDTPSQLSAALARSVAQDVGSRPN